MNKFWKSEFSSGNKASFVKEPIKFTAVILVMALSLFTGFSLIWNINNIKQEQVVLATAEARANWNKDQAFRGWATKHGGVYVVPNERTPPSPYLAHIPDRDVVTTNGMKLTLMNPAYMMRQMIKEYEKSYGIRGSITGKILLNPDNAPDAWERRILELYDQQPKEVVEQTDIDGAPYIRLMKPMMMQQGCMKCHGHLGFKVGDVRGAVSVSIPLKPYFDTADLTIRSMKITHGVIWLAGFVGVILFSRSAYKREAERLGLLGELENNQNLLELRVEERTRELKDKEIELLNVQARGHYANKMVALGEMAGGMAHEINSPLQSVSIATYRIRKYMIEHKQHDVDEHLSLVDKSVHKITNIIDSLREVSRHSTNDSFEWALIADIIESVTNITVERYNLANIKFTVNYYAIDSSYKLYCQPVQIEQIIMNLLNNAYDAVQGLDTKWIRLDVQAKDEFIYISVEDSGEGVAAEIQDKIFEPLFTTKDIGKGTGLGLSISAEIARKHGGSLSLDSSAVNTRFILELPKHNEQ